MSPGPYDCVNTGCTIGSLLPKELTGVPVGRVEGQGSRGGNGDSRQIKVISMVKEKRGEPTQRGTLDTAHLIHTDHGCQQFGMGSPSRELLGPGQVDPRRKRVLSQSALSNWRSPGDY